MFVVVITRSIVFFVAIGSLLRLQFISTGANSWPHEMDRSATKGNSRKRKAVREEFMSRRLCTAKTRLHQSFYCLICRLVTIIASVSQHSVRPFEAKTTFENQQFPKQAWYLDGQSWYTRSISSIVPKISSRRRVI